MSYGHIHIYFCVVKQVLVYLRFGRYVAICEHKICVRICVRTYREKRLFGLSRLFVFSINSRYYLCFLLTLFGCYTIFLTIMTGDLSTYVIIKFKELSCYIT